MNFKIHTNDVCGLVEAYNAISKTTSVLYEKKRRLKSAEKQIMSYSY